MNSQEWAVIVKQGAELVEQGESFQLGLGKLSFEVYNQYGFPGLTNLSNDIKETYGFTRRPKTLMAYAWVYERTGDLGLPIDLSFRARQSLASVKDPKAWAERIKTEGLDSDDVWNMIRKEKNLPDKKPKTVVCDHCGAVIQL